MYELVYQLLTQRRKIVFQKGFGKKNEISRYYDSWNIEEEKRNRNGNLKEKLIVRRQR